MTNRIPEGRNQFAKESTALFERPRSQVGTGENQEVEA